MPAAFSEGDPGRFDSAAVFSPGSRASTTRSEKSSLRDQAHETLRAALISGRMRPGMLYSAPALANMLGVSPTPVREAMLDLAKEGLVVVERNRGFRVTEVSDRELDELVATRILLEVPTMGEVADKYEPSMENEMAGLRDLARELEAAAEGNDIVNYLRLDTEFHTSFLALQGNAEIVKIVRRLRSRSRLFGLEALARAGTLITSTREHMQMIDLAIAGDREGLENLTRIHLSHTRTTWASTSPD